VKKETLEKKYNIKDISSQLGHKSYIELTKYTLTGFYLGEPTYYINLRPLNKTIDDYFKELGSDKE